MIKNLHIHKKIIASMLVIGLLGGSFGGYKMYRHNEIKRVKGYLKDFTTEENYVDLSKISSDYDIKGFKGEYLYEALKDSDISYVRITDSYIFDGSHVTGFSQKNAVNYDMPLCIDNNGDINYAMYEPKRVVIDSGLSYDIPEGYQLEDIIVYAEPIRYDELKGKEIVVDKNNYEDSYSLSLTNGRSK